MIGNLPSIARNVGLIPHQGTKTPHAVEQLSLCATTAEPVCSRARAPEQKLAHVPPRRHSAAKIKQISLVRNSLAAESVTPVRGGGWGEQPHGGWSIREHVKVMAAAERDVRGKQERLFTTLIELALTVPSPELMPVGGHQRN